MIPPARDDRPIRRVLGAGVAAAVFVTAVVAWLNTTNVTAQVDGPANPLVLGDLRLELIDHSIDVPANGDLLLTYQITGALADAELLFIDQNTTPPTVSTTIPERAGNDPSSDSKPSVSATLSPATISPAEPSRPTALPVPLSVNVIVDDPLDEVSDLIGRLGSDVSSTVFLDPIDGIQIADIRPAITVADDGTAVLKLVVPTDTGSSQADRLRLDVPGLYPLLVTLRIDGKVIARHGTILNRRGSTPVAAKVRLAAMAAVPQPDTLLESLDSLVAQTARVSEFADLTDMPIFASLPPDVVTELVDSASDEVIPITFRDDSIQALPATPFNISSAVAVGLEEAFVRQLTIGEEQLQAALPGVPVRRDVWFIDRPLSSEAASLLRRLGVRALIMTPDTARVTLTPLPTEFLIDRSIPVRLDDGSELPVLLIDLADDRFGTMATENALIAGTATEWAIDHLARLRLMIIERANDGVDPLSKRARVLAADDLGVLDYRLLNELVRLDDTTEVYDVVEIDDLASTSEPQELNPTPSLPTEAGPSLAGRQDEIKSIRLALVDATSMLAENDQRIAVWEQMLDALVSTAYTDDAAAAALLSLRSEIDGLAASIVLPEPFSLTFTSRTETVPLTIGNTSDEPLLVRLELSSERLRFPDDNLDVVLGADGVTEVEIPVEALTNGTTSMDVAVVTPLGGSIANPVRVTTRVQSLSGLAHLVTATLLLLLLTWWLTHWRAGRSRRG